MDARKASNYFETIWCEVCRHSTAIHRFQVRRAFTCKRVSLASRGGQILFCILQQEIVAVTAYEIISQLHGTDFIRFAIVMFVVFFENPRDMNISVSCSNLKILCS